MLGNIPLLTARWIWLFFVHQAKLTEGLSLAKEFNSNVQDLLNKMAKCEESIGLLPSPSFVLDTICGQLQAHKVNTCVSG